MGVNFAQWDVAQATLTTRQIWGPCTKLAPHVSWLFYRPYITGACLPVYTIYMRILSDWVVGGRTQRDRGCMRGPSSRTTRSKWTEVACTASKAYRLVNFSCPWRPYSTALPCSTSAAWSFFMWSPSHPLWAWACINGLFVHAMRLGILPN